MNDHFQPSPDVEQPDHQSPQRLLRRSRNDRVLGGVSGGIGRYFGIDPILIRLAWVALVLAAGTGILLYIICWIVIPEETEGEYPGTPAPTSPRSTLTVRYLIGGAFIAIGGMLLLRMLLPEIGTELFWAIVLIAIGLVIVLQGTRR